MSLSPSLRAEIYKFLKIKILNKIEGYNLKEEDSAKPFQYALFTKKDYQRWTCLKFFDKGHDFLIGHDFWNFLGGAGTYENLITIYEQIGEEIRPILEQKFKTIAKQYKNLS